MVAKAAFLMRTYNTEERFLRKAIESVLNQSESNFVFFIRDNGSTDNTKNILKEYAKLDKRIILYRNNKNNYHTDAENREREEIFNKYFVEAGVEYFAVIDSDDYYDVDFLKITYEEAKKNNVDIVIVGNNFIKEQDEQITSTRIPPRLILDNKKISYDHFCNLYGSLRTLWGKLYSRKWWEKYWYELNLGRPTELISGSDTYVILTIVREMNKICTLNIPLYNYRVRKGSVYTSSIDYFRIKEGEILFNKGVECAKAWNVLSEQSVTFLCNVYFNHIKDLLLIIATNNNIKFDDKIEYIRNVLNDQFFCMLCKKNDEFIYEVYKTFVLLIKIYGCDIKQKIVSAINLEITSHQQKIYEEVLIDIDNNDFLNANIRIRSLLTELPLTAETIYLKLFIEIKRNNKEGMDLFSYVASNYFYDDNEIMNLVNFIQNLNKEMIVDDK